MGLTRCQFSHLVYIPYTTFSSLNRYIDASQDETSASTDPLTGLDERRGGVGHNELMVGHMQNVLRLAALQASPTRAAQLFVERYKVKRYPYIAILDPRTGMVVWCWEDIVAKIDARRKTKGKKVSDLYLYSSRFII